MKQHLSKKFVSVLLSITVFFLTFISVVSPTGKVSAAEPESVGSTEPFIVYDFLPAPGQFVNATGTGGIGDLNLLHSKGQFNSVVTLGAFGGSMVLRMNEPIYNTADHPYGVDFTVNGNAFAGNEEPAALAVAEADENGNPIQWYQIAGSEHYEDTTKWDYSVTYTNPDPEFLNANGVSIPWKDNYDGEGLVRASFYKRAHYPIPSNYPLSKSVINPESMSYSGVKIETRKPAFGYADVYANGTGVVNPYVPESIKGAPIDISWAVKSDGTPANLQKIDFVKIYTAVQIDAGVFGEVSAEIASLQTTESNAEVKQTPDLQSILLTGDLGMQSKRIPIQYGQNVYQDIKINADAIKITAEGNAANIYVNNQKVAAGVATTKAISLSKTEPRLVRVIAQDGQNEPRIYYLSILKGTDAIDSNIEKTADYTLKQGVASEWQAIGLAAAGQKVPESYYDKLVSGLKTSQGTYNNVTDYARISIAISALGYDATKFENYNLIEKIYNNSRMLNQGVNGPIYSLIALDAKNYNVPSDAVWTRDKLVQAILDKQLSDGGFAWSASAVASEPDMTAMALIALSPYKAQSDVQSAGEKAIQWLANNQQPHGGYNTYGSDSSESVSQAIIALSSFGVDSTGEAFTKKGTNLLDKLYSFARADGGFAHVADETSSNGMATEQALQALVAAKLYSENSGRLYSFSGRALPGVEFPSNIQISIEGPQSTLASGTSIGKNAMEALVKFAAENELALAGAESNYITKIGQISAGNYGGYDGWMYAVQRNNVWITPTVGMTDFKLSDSDRILVYYGDFSTELVHQAVVSPSSPTPGQEFQVSVTKETWDWTNNRPVITPAAGVKVSLGSQSAITDANGAATFASGLPAVGKVEGEITGYVLDASPLVVRQPFSVTVVSVPPVGETKYAKLSVTGDSAKGVILASKSIALQAGDTAFSILKRELGSKVISSGSGVQTYVSSIDGLAEFDRGPKSGWLYSVNGIYPDKSAGVYDLKENDVVEWKYTTGETTETPGTSVTPSVPSAGSVSQDILTELAKLNLPTNNSLPVNKVGQTTSVLNAQSVMTASESEAIKKALDAVIVSLSKEASPNSGTTISDQNSEIQLVVPAGAVKANTNFTVQELSENRPELVSSVYQFGPDGATFEKPVYIQIKVALADRTPSNLTLAWLNETTGEWIPVPAVFDAKTGNIVGPAMHFTKFAVIDRSQLEVTAEKTFADDAAIAAWARDAVYRVFRDGIMTGISEAEAIFAPKKEMTRAEFASLIIRALDVEQSKEAVATFDDVRPNSWYFGAVMKAKELGIIQGVSASKFQPEKSVTREEMAIMIAKAFKLTALSDGPAFNDKAAIYKGAVESVEAVASHKLMLGSGGNFLPKQAVTREMAAVVADKLRELAS